MDIRFVSSLTSEDERLFAPALLKAVAAILDQLPIAYTVRIETTGADVFQHAHAVEEPLKVVKRLIGVPGDTLSMDRGQLYRNGKAISEPWVIRTDPNANADAYQRERMRRWQIPHLVAGVRTETYHPDLNNWGPIVVPPDSFFMMGDNRDGSYDGRYWGFLPRDNVRGRPLVVYFSYDPNSWRSIPFLTAVRWGRIFTAPH